MHFKCSDFDIDPAPWPYLRLMEQLVEILLDLSNAENMNAAVLQAIDSSSMSIAALALRHPRYQDTYKRMRRMGETDNFFKVEETCVFAW